MKKEIEDKETTGLSFQKILFECYRARFFHKDLFFFVR
jgi:hypothetical protein